MALAIYRNGNHRTTVDQQPRLTGTRHLGPHWTIAARLLRSAILNAVEHAGWRKSATANQVGCDIIDRIGQLDERGLHILQFVFAVLVRATSLNSSN